MDQVKFEKVCRTVGVRLRGLAGHVEQGLLLWFGHVK